MATLPEKIELQVVTPERHIFSEDVDSLEMPGQRWVSGHSARPRAPASPNWASEFSHTSKGSETRYLTVMYGFAEVLPDRVIVLAEISERAEEIDVARAVPRWNAPKPICRRPIPPKRIGIAQMLRSSAPALRLQAATKAGSGAAAPASRAMQHAAA